MSKRGIEAFFKHKIEVQPLKTKNAMIRKKYLEKIEGMEVDAGFKLFLLNPTQIISRHRVRGCDNLAQRDIDRINEIDTKVLKYNFISSGYSDEQIEEIVENIISQKGIETRSLDPRDYDIDKNLNISLHSNEERLKLIEEDKKAKQEAERES